MRHVAKARIKPNFKAVRALRNSTDDDCKYGVAHLSPLTLNNLPNNVLNKF